jgi:hypothetical protein
MRHGIAALVHSILFILNILCFPGISPFFSVTIVTECCIGDFTDRIPANVLWSSPPTGVEFLPQFGNSTIIFRHSGEWCHEVGGVLRSSKCQQQPLLSGERRQGFCQLCWRASRTGLMRSRLSRASAVEKKYQGLNLATRFQPATYTKVRFLGAVAKMARVDTDARQLAAVRDSKDECFKVIAQLREQVTRGTLSYHERIQNAVAAQKLAEVELSKWLSPHGVSTAVMRAIRDGRLADYPQLGALLNDAIRNHGRKVGIRHEEAVHDIFVQLLDQSGVRSTVNTARMLCLKIAGRTIRRRGKVVPKQLGLSFKSTQSAVVSLLRQRDPKSVLASVAAAMSVPITEQSMWGLRPAWLDTHPLVDERAVYLLRMMDETKVLHRLTSPSLPSRLSPIGDSFSHTYLSSASLSCE